MKWQDEWPRGSNWSHALTNGPAGARIDADGGTRLAQPTRGLPRAARALIAGPNPGAGHISQVIRCEPEPLVASARAE